ncbi:hypothetical protein [Nocardia sp. CNY236]|uniref:hypothetical protein n=1 Tax=Nocardia sp. CNY236 TaxID=1169152 RepID=UPI000419720D|nr:hypothetical protein [Nocardia sp. CNY236]
MYRVERAKLGFAVLTAAALCTAVVVMGLIVVAHARAGDWVGGFEESPVGVVSGRGDGGDAQGR